MKGYYVIEYKSMEYPYVYKYYYRSSNDESRLAEFRTFKSIVEARKACVSLINSRKAVLAVVRGINKEHIVYATVRGGYVLEDRQTSRNYWYRLNKNGTLGTSIAHGDVKKLGVIQSASQRW